jgi:hypothetical protein
VTSQLARTPPVRPLSGSILISAILEPYHRRAVSRRLWPRSIAQAAHDFRKGLKLQHRPTAAPAGALASAPGEAVLTNGLSRLVAMNR